MKIIPNKNLGYGNLIEATLNKEASTKALASMNDKVVSGMTWDEAAKVAEAELKNVQYMTEEEVVQTIKKLAEKVKFSDNTETNKLAQHWLGQGLNWIADKAQGVAQWGRDQMNNAAHWKKLEPVIVGIENTLKSIRNNPASAASLVPALMKQVGVLGQAAGQGQQPAAQQPAAQQPAAQTPIPQMAPQPQGPAGPKTLPFPESSGPKTLPI